MRLRELLSITLLLICALSAAAAGPELTNVSAVAQGNTTVLTIQANGAFAHNEYRPDDERILVDLAGVSAGKLQDQTRTLAMPGVKGYRVTGFSGAAGAQVARVELMLLPGADVKLSDGNGAVTLHVNGTAAPKPAPAVAAKATVAANVRDIRVQRSVDGVELHIVSDSAISPKTLTLVNPDRIVVDLPNALVAPKGRQLSVNSGNVIGVRMSRFQVTPPVTRVVIDLKAPQEFTVGNNGSTVVVRMKAQAPVMNASAKPAQPVVEKPAAPAQAIAAEKPKSEPAVEQKKAQVVATAAPTAAGQDPKGGAPKNSAQDFVMVEPSYQAKNEAPKQVAQAQTPLPPTAQQPTTTQQPAPTQQPVVTPAPLPTSPAPTTQQERAINFAAEQRAQQQQGSAYKGPRYTGEPISVNLKDVDIKDFFRLIHEISGLNLVLDPGVSGTLTLVLDDVPWDQALDIVLKNNALDRQLEGNVLRIASIDALRKEADARRLQIQAQALAVDKISVTRFLSYAHAKDVLPTIKKLLSTRGDAIADERTNALVIQDIPSTIPEVDRLLAQLDRKTQEVEIEARVVAATRTFAREIGVQLGFGLGNNVFTIGGNGDVGNGNVEVGYPTGGPRYVIDPEGRIPLFTNLGVLNPTSGLGLVNVTNNYRIDALLSAAETRGLLKILSRPRVVTQSNIQALVRQGLRIPVVTLGQLGGPPTVTYIDAFLRLTVTPQITVENTIFLNLDVENTTADFSRTVQGNPTLVTQQATTQVLVTDGGTVVIGGVIQTENFTATAQVPWLGDIPILGNLFKRRTTNTNTRELIFFITPKIIQS